MKDEESKTILVVKAYPNYELNTPEYDWEFPDNWKTSSLIGILEMIKHDLIHHNEDYTEDELTK